MEFEPDFHVRLQSDGEPQPPGDPGRSLFREVEKLREAVLQLCELQKEVAKKVEQALQSPISKEAA